MYDEEDLVAHFGQLAVSEAVAEGKTEQEAVDDWHKLPSQDEMSKKAEHEEYGAEIQTMPVKDRKILKPKRPRARRQSWIEGRFGQSEDSVADFAAAKREVEDEDMTAKLSTTAKLPTTARLPTAQDDEHVKERQAENDNLPSSTTKVSSDFSCSDTCSTLGSSMSPGGSSDPSETEGLQSESWRLASEAEAENRPSG